MIWWRKREINNICLSSSKTKRISKIDNNSEAHIMDKNCWNWFRRMKWDKENAHQEVNFKNLSKRERETGYYQSNKFNSYSMLLISKRTQAQKRSLIKKMNHPMWLAEDGVTHLFSICPFPKRSNSISNEQRKDRPFAWKCIKQAFVLTDTKLIPVC